MLLALVFLCSTPALAASSDTPARSETLQAGPYTIVVGLSNDPPIVDQSFTITVSSHETASLSGTLLAQPGAGTDAIPAHTPLTADARKTQMLIGTLRLVVRGAWTLVVSLHGPCGPGSAHLDVTVTAPGAIPVWLGWIIGLLPLIGCVWLIWQQAQYRKSLLETAQRKNAAV